MHKTLRVQLPDLRHLDCRVDFSIKTFNAVINLCKDLDIRHPEELSLSKPLDAVHLKKNFAEFPKRKLPQNEHGGRGGDHHQHQTAADTNTFIPTFSGSCNSLDNSLNGGGGGGGSGPFGSCAPMPVHRQPHLLGPAPISSPTGVSDFFNVMCVIYLQNILKTMHNRHGNVAAAVCPSSMIRPTRAWAMSPRIWHKVHVPPVRTFVRVRYGHVRWLNGHV